MSKDIVARCVVQAFAWNSLSFCGSQFLQPSAHSIVDHLRTQSKWGENNTNLPSFTNYLPWKGGAKMKPSLLCLLYPFCSLSGQPILFDPETLTSLARPEIQFKEKMKAVAAAFIFELLLVVGKRQFLESLNERGFGELRHGRPRIWDSLRGLLWISKAQCIVCSTSLFALCSAKRLVIVCVKLLLATTENHAS